jgi:hypothetical protein
VDATLIKHGLTSLKHEWWHRTHEIWYILPWFERSEDVARPLERDLSDDLLNNFSLRLVLDAPDDGVSGAEDETCKSEL